MKLTKLCPTLISNYKQVSGWGVACEFPEEEKNGCKEATSANLSATQPHLPYPQPADWIELI